MPLGELGVDLDVHPHSAGRARALVRAALGADLDPDAAMLITSELVTNAIRYARHTIQLRLSLLRDTIRLEVSDDGDGTPTEQEATELDVGGRGLTLVAALSRRWGVQPRPSGKTVWCELPAVRPAGTV